MKKNYYLFQMKTDLLNGLSLLILFILLALLYIIYGNGIVDILNKGFALTFIFMIPYFILHEVFHSLAYCMYGANFKSITYGAHLEKGVLCCLCKQNISRKNILISLLYPFIFLGVIILKIGMIFKIYPLILLSIMNISGCAGDFIMFYDLVKLSGYEFSEYDNPIAFGLYTSKDLSKVNLPGLKYVGRESNLKRTTNKKIDVSKESIIYFIIFIILGLINLFL